MPARRSAVIKLVALCLLATPGVALGQQQGDPQPATTGRTSYRSNRVLTKVIIYGSLGAIAGALGSLRKRHAADTLDEENHNG